MATSPDNQPDPQTGPPDAPEPPGIDHEPPPPVELPTSDPLPGGGNKGD
jgi:hypothetical protein